MRGLLVTASVLGALALAAAPSSLAATTDPCVLITVADASTVLGAKPPKSKAKPAGVYKTCTYTFKRKTLTVQTRTVASKAAFVKSANANPGGVFPIHGIGADAFSAGGGTVLLVWANGVEVTFKFGGVNPFVATQQSLAKTAVDRLS
jgi:hypothetical protein